MGNGQNNSTPVDGVRVGLDGAISKGAEYATMRGYRKVPSYLCSEKWRELGEAICRR